MFHKLQHITQRQMLYGILYIQIHTPQLMVDTRLTLVAQFMSNSAVIK